MADVRFYDGHVAQAWEWKAFRSARAEIKTSGYEIGITIAIIALSGRVFSLIRRR